MSAANPSNINRRPSGICSRCGGYDLDKCETATSIWSGGKPYIVERIPALRCATCSEVHINNATAETLKKIDQDLRIDDMTVRKIEVPVITFPATSSQGPSGRLAD